MSEQINSDGEYIEPGVYDGGTRETSFSPKSYGTAIENYNEKRGQKKQQNHRRS